MQNSSLSLKIKFEEKIHKIPILNYFFGVPHLTTFIFNFSCNVIASIAYIHPVYGAGV